MQRGIEGDGKGAPSLQATMAGIRKWHERRIQADPDGAVVKGHVAKEISRYLGSAAADRILEPVTEHSKLFPAVEPVLAIFLGCRAAGRLVHHIIESRIVRI